MVRTQCKVLAVPAGGKGDLYPATREIVHNSPFLGHANRIVEGQNDATGPEADALGLLAEGRVQDHRTGVQAAHLREMALGQPDGGKTVLVGKARGPEEKIVFVPPGVLLLAAEKQQAKAHRWDGCASPGRWRLGLALVLGNEIETVL